MEASPRRPRPWVYVAVAVVAACELAAAGTLLGRPAAAPSGHHGARPSPTGDATRQDAVLRHDASRVADVTATLARRAAAIRAHDRRAFAATLDRAVGTFRAAQLRMFDALAEVPIAAWSYTLDPDGAFGPDSAYLRKYRVDAWAPQVVLRYRLAGFDAEPTVVTQSFTFVHRGPAWLAASDRDIDAQADRRTGRDLWDFGPVRVVRGRHALVLGHPANAALLRDVARQEEAAVPRVTSVWGSDWDQRAVVVVPDTAAELAAIIGEAGDLSQIAAVAVAQLGEGSGPYHTVGNRIVVNTTNFRRLGSTGRRVVLTHETTHVASRNSSVHGVPTWVVEGFADYVGYLDTGLAARVVCQELTADVRAGRAPRALPDDAAFDGGSKVLAQAYEEAWLAAHLVADTVGQRGLVAFYRTLGNVAAAGPDPVGVALRDVLHTTPAAFTKAWRAYVVRKLG